MNEVKGPITIWGENILWIQRNRATWHTQAHKIGICNPALSFLILEHRYPNSTLYVYIGIKLILATSIWSGCFGLVINISEFNKRRNILFIYLFYYFQVMVCMLYWSQWDWISCTNLSPAKPEQRIMSLSNLSPAAYDYVQLRELLPTCNVRIDTWYQHYIIVMSR